MYRVAVHYSNHRPSHQGIAKQPDGVWEGRLRSEEKTFEVR
jgi:hypothetical protein